MAEFSSIPSPQSSVIVSLASEENWIDGAPLSEQVTVASPESFSPAFPFTSIDLTRTLSIRMGIFSTPKTFRNESFVSEADSVTAIMGMAPPPNEFCEYLCLSGMVALSLYESPSCVQEMASAHG